MNAGLNFLVRWRMTWAGRRWRRPFLRLMHDPAAAQARLLRAILRRNQATTFGREHHFAEIDSPETYAARVPIQTYEDLRPYIERQETQKTPELLAVQPIMYAQTSGTTGKPKYIPILADTVTHYRQSQRIYAQAHHSAIPGLFSGKTLAFVSPAIEGWLPTGTPFGSMSGLIYQSMPWLLRRKYVVPAAVFACADHALKYELIATFALAERDITYVAGANPSTFLKVAEVISQQADTLVAAVETGVIPGREKLDQTTYRGLQAVFRRDPQRAMELRVLFAAGEVTFAKLWPQLKAVSCWREGSCRVLLPALQRQLPAGVPILELGYLASECRGSLVVDSLRRLEVPTLHENYFEFIERDDWEAGGRQVRTVAQLEAGRVYHVIITTQTGLYRYFMNDLVTVDGFYEKTPTIKFLEKGAGATNITGEKLYESQVCEAVETLLRRRDWSPAFFLLVADPGRQGYILYWEAPGGAAGGLADELDTELAARNLEYKSKRSSGRLRPIALKSLRPGAGEAYKAQLVAQGQREAQFKFVRLQLGAKVAFDFEAWLESAP